MTVNVSQKDNLDSSEKTELSTRRLLIGIWFHLSKRRRLQLGFLLVVMLVSGISELFTLGSIFPFLAVLSNPNTLWDQQYIQSFSKILGITDPYQLVLPTTILFASASLFAAFIRLINLWLNCKLAAAIGSDLSCEAYRRTLYQPYEVHLQRNSASVITTTTTQIIRTVQALTALLQMITALVVALGLLAGLLFINWKVAVAAAVLLGSIYRLLASTARQQLRSNSKKISYAAKQQIKALQEGLGAIRDVLLNGNQNTYVEIYRRADRPQRQLTANNQFLATFPRYAIEGLSLTSIAFLGFGMVQQQQGQLNAVSIVPLLGALAMGAQRLLPALQQIYASWSSLKALSADLSNVLEMLEQSVVTLSCSQSPFKLQKSIEFLNVSFAYNGQMTVLKNFNLTIRKGERLGIVGSTGSGKSTTIDLLMGLLKPTSGQILIDGCDLHETNQPGRIGDWMATISHVPQSIYLSDSTIAENIAFGVAPNQIDYLKVKAAAEQAQVSSFIESTPEGFNTFVGERGVRLSGGQRQRIGIARALYKNASILVLDEATSALDGNTEKALMESVEALSNDLTIIMIAHRISTLDRCDRIVEIAMSK